jgi:hypothetical protein
MKDSCLGVHVFYCTECGEVFNGKQGCSKHAYVEGFNTEQFESYTGKKPPTVRINTGFGKQQDKAGLEPQAEDQDWNQTFKPKRKEYRRKPRKDKEEENDDDAKEHASNDKSDKKTGRGKKKGNM